MSLICVQKQDELSLRKKELKLNGMKYKWTNLYHASSYSNDWKANQFKSLQEKICQRDET